MFSSSSSYSRTCPKTFFTRVSTSNLLISPVLYSPSFFLYIYPRTVSSPVPTSSYVGTSSLSQQLYSFRILRLTGLTEKVSTKMYPECSDKVVPRCLDLRNEIRVDEKSLCSPSPIFMFKSPLSMMNVLRSLGTNTFDLTISLSQMDT